MATWDLIATAPIDGSDVLVAVLPGGRQLVARWNIDLPGGGWVAVDDYRIHPTHWQKLPDPPKEAPVVAPVVTTLSPASAALGDPNFTLSVHGTGFGPDAVISWNGVPEPTTVVSATEVTTGVNMATATVAMPIPVFVQNGTGPMSNTIHFNLTDPATMSRSRKRDA